MLDAVVVITIEGPATPPVASASEVYGDANIILVDNENATGSKGNDIPVTIDSGITGFTVSLSGQDPNIAVYDSHGRLLNYWENYPKNPYKMHN